MTSIKQILFSSPVLPPGGGLPKQSFLSGPIQQLYREANGEFTIICTVTGSIVRTNVSASWQEIPEPLPTKAQLLDKIDAMEEKTLGTRKGKKVEK